MRMMMMDAPRKTYKASKVACSRFGDPFKFESLTLTKLGGISNQFLQREETVGSTIKKPAVPQPEPYHHIIDFNPFSPFRDRIENSGFVAANLCDLLSFTG